MRIGPLNMDEHGQAFSVFKLLIAAIIAIAILWVLYPIILQVMGLIKNNPTEEVNKLLSVLVDQPGAVRRTVPVVFEPGSVLTGSAVTNRISISKDQVCMSTGQFSESGGLFEFVSSAEQNRLIYHGSTDQTVEIAVVCNVEYDGELEEDIDIYGLDYSEGNSITSACDDLCPDDTKCCAVIIERA